MERLGEDPHLVSVHDTGEADGRPYIVSRYMPGGNVQRLLASSEAGKLQVAQAIAIGIDVCRALEHAHGCGVVHRDIKPANVWLAEDGAARLGDFSLAGIGAGGSDATLVGTVAYLPPERALGRPSGPPGDLYSLGALLYEMVAGQPPFTGGDAVSIIGRHLNADPVAPSRHNPAVPGPLDDLILALLAKSPGERPESAAAVREALQVAPSEPSEPAEGDEEEQSARGPCRAGVRRPRARARPAARRRRRDACRPWPPGPDRRRARDRQDPDRRGARDLRAGARREGATGAAATRTRAHPPTGPGCRRSAPTSARPIPVALAWEMGSGAADIAQRGARGRGAHRRVTLPPWTPTTRRRGSGSSTRSAGFLGAARPRGPWSSSSTTCTGPTSPRCCFCSSSRGRSATPGLLVIGTYRDVELGRHHPLSQMLGELAGAGLASRVALHGLARSTCARYIEMTAGARPSPELVRAVHDQTEGNPFFLAEVVRLLAAEGTLDRPRRGDAGDPAGCPRGGRPPPRPPRRSRQTRRCRWRRRSAATSTSRSLTRLPKPTARQWTRRSPRRSRPSFSPRARRGPLPLLARPGPRDPLRGAQRGTAPALHRAHRRDAGGALLGGPDPAERHLAELAHHFLEGAARRRRREGDRLRGACGPQRHRPARPRGSGGALRARAGDARALRARRAPAGGAPALPRGGADQGRKAGGGAGDPRPGSRRGAGARSRPSCWSARPSASPMWLRSAAPTSE